MSCKKSKKIVFISINDVWRYGNIGMDQLLGFLRNKGFDIDIKYYDNKTSTVEEIVQASSYGYDVVCFSVNSSNYNKCYNISRELKKNRNVIIVFGGGYVTRFYMEVLSNCDIIDYLILGDGELPCEYLFNCICDDQINVCHEAIVTKNDYLDKKPAMNSVITWNPAYDYYIKDSNRKNSRKVHCIQIKNNVCTGNCSFCNEIHGKIVYKKIDDIVNQIEYVHKTFNVKKFFFTDDNILDPNDKFAKENLGNLCKKLKEKKLKLAYQCYIKANSLVDNVEDNELLDLMRSVGFVEIFIGVEAGNQFDLDLYKKNITVKQNYEIVNLIYKHNIFPILGYIAFNPYSTKETILQNFKFLCDVNCTYLHNYLYSFLVVNKYTNIYYRLKKDNLLLNDENKFLDIDYRFVNSDVETVLKYVKNEMIPRLNRLDYELDWVTYSKMEHEIWFDNIIDYSDFLRQKKIEDLAFIKSKLSILFVEFDVKKFEKIANDFWSYFYNESNQLKLIYDYYISLHRKNL